MDINGIFDIVMPVLLMLALCVLYNIIFIYNLHKGWIRKGKTVEFFPAWNGTKKPFYWFLGWSIAKCAVDMIIFLVYFFVVKSIGRIGLMMLMPGVWIVGCFFEMIFYAISETIAVSIVRRKNPQPNEGASNTDVIADGVIGNEEADLTDEELNL